MDKESQNSQGVPAARQIATFPPLQVLTGEEPPSPRTGEPKRPWLVAVAMVLQLLAVVAVAVTYGLHWWEAAHADTYATSARLIEWVEPEPGKWLSLTLEGALAAVAALVAGVTGVVGVQAWHGWHWTRWMGFAAIALQGVVVALFSWWGLIGLGLAVVGTALLFLPPISKFFSRFDAHRAERPTPYRRPERIFYGRLPRFR